ncbi:MAG TPA: hypothetical protein VLA68_05115 [Nitrososphaera sp.]|nr:hypothetical protein [Nitrososphaera sp.]
MANPSAIQILTFDNFASLETHLRVLKAKYNDMIKNYEETLGFVLRDTKPSSLKSQQLQQKWAEEMQQALSANDPRNKPTPGKKDDGKKMFGNSKEKHNPAAGEWVALDPMSVFVGPKNKGLAEIYFDTINVLRENVSKINMALSICGAVKAKAAMSGNTSLVVSFVNDIPTKVLLRPADDSSAKKYTMSFSFAVPSMPPAAHYG